MNKKGIVLTPSDFIGVNWAAKMENIGLNTLGIHSGGGHNHDIIENLGKTASTEFCTEFESRGIDCEYEVHAPESLIAPQLFEAHPEYFAMKYNCNKREHNSNWCVTNPDVPYIIAEGAKKLACSLHSTKQRYYFWSADQKNAFCHCKECSKYSPSELNMIGVNAIAKGIKRSIPSAKIAYLAYNGCYEVPERIEPDPSVFLEFAPYIRCYHHAINDPNCYVNQKFCTALKKLIRYFSPEESHILEYWLDSSLFSDYVKPGKKPFLSQEILQRDIDFYCSMGIKNITTFGVYMDGEYFKRHGDKELQLYADTLNKFLTD